MKESREKGVSDGLFNGCEEGSDVGCCSTEVGPLILEAMSKNCIGCLRIFDCSYGEIMNCRYPWLNLWFDPGGKEVFVSNVATKISHSFDILKV